MMPLHNIYRKKIEYIQKVQCLEELCKVFGRNIMIGYIISTRSLEGILLILIKILETCHQCSTVCSVTPFCECMNFKIKKMASSTTPAKLIDPPPIDSLQYSAEKGLGFLFESLEKKKKPTTTLVSSKVETTAKVTATTQLPSLILDQSFYDPISPSSSSSSVIIAKNKIGYSSVFVDKLLEGNSNVIYRWNVKIINLNSWFSLGVANTSIVKDHRFSFTPFDEHGQFMFSANGYIWDRRIAGDTKHLVIKGGSYGVGDVITVELDTRIGQLTFLKNGIVVSSVKNIGLPVYPSFMMHGTESVEFMGVTETEAMDAVQTFEFVYPKHHYKIDIRFICFPIFKEIIRRCQGLWNI